MQESFNLADLFIYIVIIFFGMWFYCCFVIRQGLII